MADHLRTELVLDALEMAIWNRRPGPGLIHHSDQGCQYTSLAFGRRLREARLVGSMGSVGDAYDCDDPGTAVGSGLTLAKTDRGVLALTCRPLPSSGMTWPADRAGSDLIGA